LLTCILLIGLLLTGLQEVGADPPPFEKENLKVCFDVLRTGAQQECKQTFEGEGGSYSVSFPVSISDKGYTVQIAIRMCGP
jgi:hypothetical protein